MLTILPYDKKYLESSYQFLVETFKISFGSDQTRWPNNLGNYSFEKYRIDIEKFLMDQNCFFFGVYDDQKFVGQIELKKLDDCGYVSFYYLVNEYRKKGLGKQLDEFALQEFKRQGCHKIRLTVSELNEPGRRFYEKNGWKSLGPDPKRPMGWTMEKEIK